jgi:hypothetical protein
LFAELDRASEPVPMSGCRIWLGTTTKQGYGTLAGKYAHRLSFERRFGKVTSGLHVLHRCDVPCCINQDHLFLGTQQDNNEDKINKGRAKGGSLKGAHHPMVKLSAEDVLSIRRAYSDGETQTAIAKRFGVLQNYVSAIVARKYWKHI